MIEGLGRTLSSGPRPSLEMTWTVKRRDRPATEAAVQNRIPRQYIDRNRASRILACVRAYNARHRAPGEHIGPVSRCGIEVLVALLFKFGASTGLRYPALETLAIAAGVSRSSAAVAIRALEACGVLVVHRRRQCVNGRWVACTNAYTFGNGTAASRGPGTSESRNRTERPKQISKGVADQLHELGRRLAEVFKEGLGREGVASI
jgi:hypothetical protein